MAILKDCNSDIVDDYFPTPRILQTWIVATTDIQDLNTALDDGTEKTSAWRNNIRQKKALNDNLKKNEIKNFGSITILYGLKWVPVTQEQMIWSGLAS